MKEIEVTIELLNNYILELQKNEFLRDHDERFSDLRKVVKNKAKNLNKPLNVVSERLYNIADGFFFIAEIFRYKFYLLAKSIIHAIETENPLSLANNTRSLLEQVAVVMYCTSSVVKMLDDLKNQGSIKKIDAILNKAEVILHRTYSGQGSKIDESKENEAIHVNTAIKSLSKELSDALDVYNYLCEFVHPNYGNNLLVSSGKLGEGKIKTKTASNLRT